MIGNTDAWTAECPAHPDFAQDLLIQRSGDGRVWLTCKAGCDKEDIVRRICLELEDLHRHAEFDTGAGYGEMT